MTASPTDKVSDYPQYILAKAFLILGPKADSAALNQVLKDAYDECVDGTLDDMRAAVRNKIRTGDMADDVVMDLTRIK